MWMYITVFISLLAIELAYLYIARRFGIVDAPNERSSHTTAVIRGGGIILPSAIFLWAILASMMGAGNIVLHYWPFLTGLLILAVTGLVDDLRSLTPMTRLIIQFLAVGLMLFEVLGQEPCFMEIVWYWKLIFVVLTLIVLVGSVNIINFMDGINGITAGYSLTVLVSLLLVNKQLEDPFLPNSFLWVSALGVVVFALFNFRAKGKAKCFAGDVGSLSIGLIMLFAISKLIVKTGDLTWFVLIMIYGVDGCLTIVHRIMLHEHLSVAHRKHAYQLMANELVMSHVRVSVLYMMMQLVISMTAIYIIPNTMKAHWTYFICVALVMGGAYVCFMKKYYYLHDEYLKQVKEEKQK